MKVLVTGSNGQLGFDICRELAHLGIEHRGAGRADFDLTDERQTRCYIEGCAPDVVVHCAAYTAVDRAETDREACRAVNVLGTRHVADGCRALNAKMVYISTDYVFDGHGEDPFEADSWKNPINYYGLTKSLGEDEVLKRVGRHFIVRTSWVFGSNGGNFVRAMLRLGEEKDSVKVVSDQIGSPTYTVDLAALVCRMMQTKAYGTYHATNEGWCSWREFAAAIMDSGGFPAACFPSRPANILRRRKGRSIPACPRRAWTPPDLNAFRPGTIR